MKQLKLKFPSDEWRYLFLASPQQNLWDRTMRVKEGFHSLYDWEIAIKTWPHITLAAFDATIKMEPGIVGLLRQACSKQHAFTAHLEDFAGYERFKRSTLYIKVKDKDRFLRLAESLRVINNFLWSNGYASAYLVEDPHLTIAKWLPHWLYLEAMEEYSRQHFRDTFIVNELLLLKKQEHDEKYRRVATLRLPFPTYFPNQINQHAKTNYQHSRLSGA